MLRKFLQSRPAARRPSASLPPGQRIYAIGDIHGCDAVLERLIVAIDTDDRARGSSETTLVFLGDLVDRGPESAAVVERLRRLAQARPRVRVLMGNHEEIFLKSIAGDEKALKLFSRIGGRETMLSYGVDPVAYDQMDFAQLADALATVVPSEHVAFLTGFEDMVVAGDYAFVHAGVRPGVPLDEQQQRDLRWIRDPFLDFDRPLDKIIVHGHSISARLDIRRHRIGIDTGAYETGRLTALGLEGNGRWTIEAV